MSHVERVPCCGRDVLDIEKCGCNDAGCTKVIVAGKTLDRKDIEHALRCLFGEAPPGSRWFSRKLVPDPVEEA